jgi:DNA helicase-2/ATP-dependent DNA helicase PcrA
MSPSIEELYDSFQEYRGYQLNTQQKRAVESDGEGTWILAGPGTGKTETIIVRVLRLLLIDQVPPESIVLTTFTERAAKNLEDRLALYLDGILKQPQFPNVERPNISLIWTGTLHHLAHDILNQFGPGTQETTLLDEEASLFRLLRTLNTGTIQNERLYEAIVGREVPPYRRYDRIHFAEQLKTGINRTVEDNLDVAALESDNPKRDSKTSWPDDGSRDDFIGAMDQYERNLEASVDFSRLQRKFLDFLESSHANSFLEGDAERQFPGIDHLIVDEYQDTNPIQEQIYMELARTAESFVVVGDDDQALYRFRGASVDPMVTFDERLHDELDVPVSTETGLDTVRLFKNYRSREGLVEALNSYISTVGDVAQYSEARTDKSNLKAAADLRGNFPPIQIMVGKDEETLAEATVKSIETMSEGNVVSDTRQIALLAHSTKVTSRSSFKPYHDAFNDRNLPLFNPGAKNMHHDEYLKAILGLMTLVLDPNDSVLAVEGQDIKEYVGYGAEEDDSSLRALAEEYLTESPELRSWVESAIDRIDQQGWRDESDYPTNWNFLDVFYGILNRPPFSRLVDESGGPQKALEAWRFGWLSGIIESFQQNLGMNGRLFPAEDDEYTRRFYEFREEDHPDRIHGVNPYIVDSFYRDLIGVFKQGGFDEVEDEIESLPKHHYPALTVHQSKGLEFPVVFAVANEPFRGPGAEHHQEELFYPYRRSSARDIEEFSQTERAIHDAIRRFYVSISRAESLCVIALQDDVYNGLINRDEEICSQYPHLPPAWIEQLPVRQIDD